jgi:hypothetical protein
MEERAVNFESRNGGTPRSVAGRSIQSRVASSESGPLYLSVIFFVKCVNYGGHLTMYAAKMHESVKICHQNAKYELRSLNDA